MCGVRTGDGESKGEGKGWPRVGGERDAYYVANYLTMLCISLLIACYNSWAVCKLWDFFLREESVRNHFDGINTHMNEADFHVHRCRLPSSSIYEIMKVGGWKMEESI